MKNNRPYLISIYSRTPHKDENGVVSKTLWDVRESVQFESKIKHNALVSAHVIIDLLSLDIVKNRFGEDDPDETRTYYLHKYAQKIKECVNKWLMVNPDYSPTDNEKKILLTIDKLANS